MRAAQFKQFNAPLEIVEIAAPACPVDGAIVEIRACGVCRSDWHAWTGADPDVGAPHVPGHEFAGVVIETGPECRRVRAGDRVTAPFILACGHCPDCLGGDPTVCASQHVVGFSGFGAFAERLAVPHADFNLVAIPAALDFVAVAGMGCRVTTAFRGLVDRAHLMAGEWLAVHGCGGVGLSAVMIGAALGARVLAIDVNDEALAMARALGATRTLNARGLDRVGTAVRDMTSGGADVSIDALGITETFHNSIEGLKKLGRHVQIGMPLGRHAEPTVKLLELVYSRQVTIMGTRGIPASRFPALFSMIEAGRIDPGRLVTRRIGLDQAGAALQEMNGYTGVGITVTGSRPALDKPPPMRLKAATHVGARREARHCPYEKTMPQMNVQTLSARPGAALQPFETRRTFAIISHPDAGKTTLTEKLLAASGAIQQAGQVRARGNERRTRSDWMEIERQRGISVTSSVMTFEHQGLTFNLLDTPGHSDFSEDTYRTLTAVDAAVMVLDMAKGIESQTLKLFEVCRLRDIPIITFVNKVDREGREPLQILDEIADTLALDVAPVLWPLGQGVDFHGLVDLIGHEVLDKDGSPRGIRFGRPEELLANAALASDPVNLNSIETLALAQEALPEFDLETYRAGHLTPVLFGSALKGVGVTQLLRALGGWAPSPRPQPAEPAPIEPGQPKVSGFVFKVQANMDANHRDRIAFVRLSSGTFRRGMKLRNVRSGKDISVTSPMFFFGNDREIADEAVAGDIVGIPNHGTLSVGDTLSEGQQVKVTGIPNFAPEIIRRVRLSDPIKAKQLGKALNDLAEEGVAQVFRRMVGADWLVGVVGALQLDVLQSRIEKEYGVPIAFESAGFEMARWVSADEPAELKRFIEANRMGLAEDRAGDPIYLAQNLWYLQRMQKDWPKIEFHATRERA